MSFDSPLWWQPVPTLIDGTLSGFHCSKEFVGGKPDSFPLKIGRIYLGGDLIKAIGGPYFSEVLFVRIGGERERIARLVNSGGSLDSPVPIFRFIDNLDLDSRSAMLVFGRIMFTCRFPKNISCRSLLSNLLIEFIRVRVPEEQDAISTQVGLVGRANESDLVLCFGEELLKSGFPQSKLLKLFFGEIFRINVGLLHRYFPNVWFHNQGVSKFSFKGVNIRPYDRQKLGKFEMRILFGRGSLTFNFSSFNTSIYSIDDYDGLGDKEREMLQSYVAQAAYKVLEDSIEFNLAK